MPVSFDEGFYGIGLTNLNILSISLNHPAIFLSVQSLGKVMLLRARHIGSREEVRVGWTSTRTDVNRSCARGLWNFIDGQAWL